MNPELRADLERAGWYYIGQRTTPAGLTLYKFGQGPQASPLGRFYGYEEERTSEGWMVELDPPRLLGFVYQERMKL